ncbi:MAG: hypothetical protein ACYC9Q_09925 [Bacillota bacterium]
MSQCSICGASDAGLGGTPLVKFDNIHYCRPCLVKAKGTIKCSVCGREAFSTNASYATVNGKIICSACAPVAASGGGALPVETLTGSLQEVFKQAVTSTEQLRFALNGSSGEALVATDKRVLVLKTGLTGGGGTGKYKGFFFNQVVSVEFSCGLAYGRIQITAPGTKDFMPAEIGEARQADNVVTFLAATKDKFQAAADHLKQSVLRKAG